MNSRDEKEGGPYPKWEKDFFYHTQVVNGAYTTKLKYNFNAVNIPGVSSDLTKK